MKKLLIITSVVLFFSLGPIVEEKLHIQAAENSNVELYQDLFISLLQPYIETTINNYYADVLTESPTVYPYDVDVKEVKRIGGYRSFEFLISISVSPVVGPHNSVGEDQLIFYIDGSGNVELKKFKHLHDEKLPENWKHILKKEQSALVK